MAEPRDPFNLADRAGGPERPRAARTWTEEEQEAKLTGYIEVKPEYWPLIRYGTHMRYLTKAGEFRPGGFVAKNPFDTKPKGGPVEKRFFKLQNGFSDKIKGYTQWLAAYEDLEKVYIKPDAGVLMVMDQLETAVRGLNENIRKVAAFTKKLEGRLDDLEKRK